VFSSFRRGALVLLCVATQACGAGDSKPVACANPASWTGSPSVCGPGEVWYESTGIRNFNPFCGKLCTTTSDCSSGMACVWDWTVPTGQAVCVSDQVPAPLCFKTVIAIDGGSSCVAPDVLSTLYANEHTGISGNQRTACPNGCENLTPDGGRGYSQAMCR